MKKIKYLILILVCCFKLSKAQDTLVIFPPSPTITDTVKVFCRHSFDGGDCSLDTVITSINGNHVMVSACYIVGPFDIMCTASDTTVIGILPAGINSLEYKFLKNGGGGGACFYLESKFLNITIVQANAVENLQPDHQASIFPMPLNESAVLRTPRTLNDAVLHFYDVLGSLVRTDYFSGKEYIINRMNLSAGIYHYEIINDSNQLFTGKIVIQ